MRKILHLLAVTLSFTFCSAQDFDWDSYSFWEPTTQYDKTIYVDQNASNASDKNDGSTSSPLKTIQAAVEKAQAGEKVLVASGVYREIIRPVRSGIDENKMIAIEAAQNANVIVKGSFPWKPTWVRRTADASYEDTLITISTSRQVWFATLPDELVKDFNPFAKENVNEEEFKLMKWAEPEIGNSPFTLKQGMLYQNGKRMIQFNDYGDLAKLPGSFWVDKDSKTLHIHAYESVDPNTVSFEVAVLPHLLRPKSAGLGYIAVKGITFEHCANSMLRGGEGAVSSMGGHHWLFEGNTIREINSSGLEFGDRAFEYKDKRRAVYPRVNEDKGSVIARKNTIYECGTAGIRSLTVTNALVENNHIHHCGWQNGERYWECAGIKMLVNTKTLVRRNHVHHITDGAGIWMDWNNKYTRVTQNYIHDVTTTQGGVFIEASVVPNLVDNNVIWNIDGNGIYGNDSDGQLYYNNLFGNIHGSFLNIVVATDRNLNGVPLTADSNHVKNNVFVNASDTNKVSGKIFAENNTYVFDKDYKSEFDLKYWQTEKGADQDAQMLKGKFAFSTNDHTIKIDPTFSFQLSKTNQAVSTDFFGAKRKKKSYPGPFSSWSETIELMKRFD